MSTDSTALARRLTALIDDGNGVLAALQEAEPLDMARAFNGVDGFGEVWLSACDAGAKLTAIKATIEGLALPRRVLAVKRRAEPYTGANDTADPQ